MNDDDQENNGEAKTDNDDNDDESEDGVFGLTTVIDLKKHKVNEREFFKIFSLIVSYWDQENCAISSVTGMKRSVFKML